MTDTWLQKTLTLQRIEQSIKDNLAHTEAHSLPIRACYTLKSLYECDGQRATDLAKQAGSLPTSFTPVLDSLERRAFVKRKASPEDRRSVLIFLTVKGKALQKAIEYAITKAETECGEGSK